MNKLAIVDSDMAWAPMIMASLSVRSGPEGARFMMMEGVRKECCLSLRDTASALIRLSAASSDYLDERLRVIDSDAFWLNHLGVDEEGLPATLLDQLTIQDWEMMRGTSHVDQIRLRSILGDWVDNLGPDNPVYSVRPEKPLPLKTFDIEVTVAKVFRHKQRVLAPDNFSARTLALRSAPKSLDDWEVVAEAHRPTIDSATEVFSG